MKTKLLTYLFAVMVALAVFCPASPADISDDYADVYPYVKYFMDRALDDTTGFEGLTRSYQLSLGESSPADQGVVDFGAAAYDQSILGRICLYNGDTTILDTYVEYFKNNLDDSGNPLINCNDAYYDENNDPLNYGSYRMARILGRDSVIYGEWWHLWDWAVDTGAAACFIIYSIEAYELTLNQDYVDLATLFGDYILRLQDTDGGIRYGPRGINKSDYFWNMKSTEQNERACYALRSLYSITGDLKYENATDNITSWLKNMYNFSVHLFYSASIFDGIQWQPTDFGYVATDVTAFAPIETMFNDIYFGAVQAERNAEIDAMFQAIEDRTAFLNMENKPYLFRFSVSDGGTYGSVEISSQMALAYIKTARNYHEQGNVVKENEYLDKYNTLMGSLETYFTTPAGDPESKIAPYASFLDGSVAGNVPMGTGFYTFNCEAALASSYYALTKIKAIELYADNNTPITLACLDIAGESDVVIDFGPNHGIWVYYNNSTWQGLHTISPEQIIKANLDNDVDGVDDLVINFGPDYGIWIYYNNLTWVRLHAISPDSMTSGDIDNDGVKDELIIDFGSPYGIWIYYPETEIWTNLHYMSAEEIVSVKGNSNMLAVDFGTPYGVYMWEEGEDWWKLHDVSPKAMYTADINNDTYDEGILDFGAEYGIWVYDGDLDFWWQFHTIPGEYITTGNIDSDPKDEIIVDFGSEYGIWVYYNNSYWEFLHDISPDWMTTGDMDDSGQDEIIVDFGDEHGIWVRYDDLTWSKIHDISP